MRFREAHPNRLRGEIAARIDGEDRILCLTLGALAELEASFQTGDLDALCRRLGSGRFSAEDLLRIIGAGLRGGGNVASDADVAEMSFEGGVPGMARLAAELLVATFGSGAGVTESKATGRVGSEAANPSPPQTAGGATGHPDHCSHGSN